MMMAGTGTFDDCVSRPVLEDSMMRSSRPILATVLALLGSTPLQADSNGIGGASSGAIAAFTVAWERPDEFRKVLSIVGSFTNLRGGHVYPEKVRASEKKPLRVFFQDGRNDNRGTGRGGNYNPERDWFLQNVRLVEAMTEKGYDINYCWGIGLHGQKQGGAMLPEMMRWLWRDHGASTDVNDKVERSFNGAAAK